jgi:hypothetical protein
MLRGIKIKEAPPAYRNLRERARLHNLYQYFIDLYPNPGNNGYDMPGVDGKLALIKSQSAETT